MLKNISEVDETFDEIIFKFVRKMVPNLTMHDFQRIDNEQVVIPKFATFPEKGNKGRDSPFDDYIEIHYYSVGLKQNGFYKIVMITKLYGIYNHVHEIIIRDVDCKEFADNFYRIEYDLSMLFFEPTQESIQPKVDYCQKVIDLIRGI